MSGIAEKFENEILTMLKAALYSAAGRNLGLDRSEGTLNKDTSLRGDLKMDNVSEALFAIEVQKKSGLNLSYKKMNSFKTIGDYMDYLYKEEIFARR